MTIPLSYSFRSLWTRRLTTVLTMSGIMLVVFVFSAVLMLSNGLRKALVATGSDNNVLIVRKASTTEIMSSVDRDQAGIVRTLPEVAVTTDGRPLLSEEVSVIINLRKFGTNDMGNIIVRGVQLEAFQLRPQVRLVAGRVFQTGTSEVLVGSSINSRFRGATIGDIVKFGGREWRVVGILDSEGSGFDSEIWCDAEQLMQAFRRPVYSAITVRLAHPTDTVGLKRTFAADPRLQQLDIRNERQFYADQSQMMSMFISILGLVITIIFSFGAMVGAMITMYAAVANRTTEIGTLRALGFGRGSILLAFMFESFLISLIGGVFGVILASGLQYITVSTTNWGSFSELAFGFSLSPDIVVSSIIFSLVMGFVGGFLPAVRASRMSILDALRSV